MTEEERRELFLILDEYLIARRNGDVILNGRVENFQIVLEGFITKIKNGDETWTAPKAARPF